VSTLHSADRAVRVDGYGRARHPCCLERNIATATMDAANAPLVLVAAAVVAVAAVFAAVAVIGVPAVAAIAVAGSREAV